MMSDQYTIA